MEEKLEGKLEENMTMEDLSEELEASCEAELEATKEAEEMDPVWATLTEYMNEKTVLTVKIGGVPCTEDTVRSGDYPLRRPFLMVTRRDARLGEAASAFLDFARSGEAAGYLSLAGAIAP